MGAVLPELSVDRFARRLLATIDTQLSAEVQERLFKHYEELRRWNPRLSLIGPGTAAEVGPASRVFRSPPRVAPPRSG